MDKDKKLTYELNFIPSLINSFYDKRHTYIYKSIYKYKGQVVIFDILIQAVISKLPWVMALLLPF